jgi:hypothetical protein
MSSTADERTSLLPPPATEAGVPRAPNGAEGLDPADPLVQSGELAEQPAKKKATAWTVVGWVVISVFVAVGTYFLVRAIRDADDVDVSTWVSLVCGWD